MLVEPLGLRGPIAGCNGGYIVNPDFSLSEFHPIDPVAARRTVDVMAQRGLDVWVYTRDAWIVPDQSGPHVAREISVLKFDPVVRAALTIADLSAAVKIVGVCDDAALVAACEQEVRDALRGLVSAQRSQPHFLDVTHPQANKGAVVITFARRLGIHTDQIATIGDMSNDVLMFRQGGLSIAMGNASDAVKAQASVVTDSNENEGFANAMYTHILRPMLS
jgi:Cof subfamily protein (haloacid dehalogenase superfamily)